MKDNNMSVFSIIIVGLTGILYFLMSISKHLSDNAMDKQALMDVYERDKTDAEVNNMDNDAVDHGLAKWVLPDDKK